MLLGKALSAGVRALSQAAVVYGLGFLLGLKFNSVHAPVDGQVMQLNVHPVEFATRLRSSYLAMWSPFVWTWMKTKLGALRTDAAASRYLRGNKQVSTPLKFVRSEPYALPKTSLTGDSTERVDMRVLQVIYGFHRDNPYRLMLVNRWMYTLTHRNIQ
jgi:hypothetical protein